MDKFSKHVCGQLKYYVYRLIDPRDNSTFYVGKGNNNRAFAHANEALKNYDGESYLFEDEDDIASKISQIRQIKDSGNEVKVVIHRWGLTEKEAFEVEAALIDAYDELTNIQSGHHSERGVQEAEILERKIGYGEFDDTNAEDFEYIVLKTTKPYVKSRGNLYEAVRGNWKIDTNRASKYKYILACVDTEIVGIFENITWEKVDNLDRYIFTGNNTQNKEIINRYLYHTIPEKYLKKGASNPVIYQK